MIESKISTMKAVFRWSLFLIPFLAVCHGQALPKKRVCVIGTGRAGLAAVKLVADKIDDFELIAFERNSEVGGLWIYRDSDIDEHGLPAHSGIYKHLKTNIRKGFMIYPDYPEFGGEEYSDIVSHKMVLEYLKNYTDFFQLQKYIQFDTLVTKIYPIKGNGDWKTTTWHLEMRNLITNEENTSGCDAIIICNGQFSKPNIPEIPGMESFPGRVLHSRSYRQPEDFANQTVVVLGAGNSGTDIASHVGAYAKKVFLSYRGYGNPFRGEDPPKNVKLVRGVIAANGSEITLQDKSTIVADAFIFSTGYLYDFPFLDERSGIIVEKKQIRPLFHQSINVEHPSMIIVGLPKYPRYGKLYYSQVTYFLKLLLGEKKLPSYEDMLEDSKNPVSFFRGFN